MADVADDRLVLHLRHVLVRDHVEVAGGRDEDVGLVAGVLHGHDAIAFHRRLQRADGIDLGDPDLGRERAQRLRRALAHVAVAADDRDLAGDHHVGRALDAVDERLTAAVEVVELGLGHRVVDVDRGQAQLAALLHLVQAMDAGRRLLGHAADARELPRVPAGLRSEPLLDRREQHTLLLAGRLGDRRGVLLGLGAQVQEQRRVAAVVQDHVRAAAVWPLEDAVRELPVLLERLALVGEDRRCRPWRSPRRRGPGSRRCCTTPSARRRRGPAASRSGPRSGSSCAASRRCARPSGAGSWRTRRGSPSGRASRSRRSRSPCGPTRRGRGRRRGSRGWRAWVGRLRTWLDSSLVRGAPKTGTALQTDSRFTSAVFPAEPGPVRLTGSQRPSAPLFSPIGRRAQAEGRMASGYIEASWTICQPAPCGRSTSSVRPVASGWPAGAGSSAPRPRRRAPGSAPRRPGARPRCPRPSASP